MKTPPSYPYIVLIIETHDRSYYDLHYTSAVSQFACSVYTPGLAHAAAVPSSKVLSLSEHSVYDARMAYAQAALEAHGARYGLTVTYRRREQR